MFAAILLFTLILFLLNKVSHKMKKKWQRFILLIMGIVSIYPYNLAILKNCTGDCAIRIDLIFIVPALITFIVFILLRIKNA